jgi:transcriptional regulator with XRE-family HTH domain
LGLLDHLLSWRLAPVADGTFTFTETDLGPAIRGLRQALGRSPEVMAQILGCSLPAYQKWELGSVVPSGDWLIRLLQLCPSEETRNAFRIRAERRSAARDGRSTTLRRIASISPEERRESWQAAREAIDKIYECGAAGVQEADARLVEFAENLQGAARHFAGRN